MSPCLFSSPLRIARTCACAGLFCALALALLCGPARAQAADPGAAAESEKLILQGVKLREQGQDAGALLLFERAYELAPTPRALTQRALAEQALGNWVQAETHLKEALAAPADPWIEQHRDLLQRSLATIGDHLGTLQVNGGKPGAELTIDGQVVGTLPLSAPLRVVVGRSMLEVKLAGHYPVRREIAVKAASISTETIELVPVPPQAVAETSPQSGTAPGTLTHVSAQVDSDSDSAKPLPSWVFWTATAATVALGGVTVWSGLNTKAKDDAYRAYVAMPGALRGEGQRGYEAADDARTRTNILIGATAGMAVVTAAVGLLFTDWGGGGGAAEPGVTLVSAHGGPSGYGVSVAQRF